MAREDMKMNDRYYLFDFQDHKDVEVSKEEFYTCLNIFQDEDILIRNVFIYPLDVFIVYKKNVTPYYFGSIYRG